MSNINNYDMTPSFYNNEDYFNSYLGCTSYYRGLQTAFKKIVSITNPKKVLELGSALGTTSLSFAEAFPMTHFIGADIREDVVDTANQKAINKPNLNFVTGDMCEVVKKQELSEYDLIFMLYSFHHILDPLENKIEFLKNCYANMKKGALLLIGETFLPEDAEKIKEDDSICKLFGYRAKEGYSSTLWAMLDNLTEDGIKRAIKAGKTSEAEETEAGKLVFNRQDEYLVKVSWLEKEAEAAGFQIVLSEPVNCVGEQMVLLVEK